MSAGAIPVVLLGKTKAVGHLVAEGLKPEYEVIHFMGSDLEVAKKDIPLLLEGSRPADPSFEGVGSEDYTKRPEAVILGAWFTNAMFVELRHATGSASMPWIVIGLTEEQRNASMKSMTLPPDADAGEAASRVKMVLDRIRDDGKWETDGVYTY